MQTITSAMSTLTPPVTLGDPSNQSRMDYVLEVSSSPDFDYPPVSQPLPALRFVRCMYFPAAREMRRGFHLRAREGNSSTFPSPRNTVRRNPRSDPRRHVEFVSGYGLIALPANSIETEKGDQIGRALFPSLISLA